MDEITKTTQITQSTQITQTTKITQSNQPKQAEPAASDKNSSQLPDFFSLAKESWNIYGQKWKTLLLIGLLSYAIVFVSALVFGLVVVVAGLASAVTKNFLALVVAAVIGGAALLYFILFFSSWLSAATVIVLRDKQEKLSLRDAMARAKPFTLSYLWITLITGAVIFFGFIFFIIPGIIFTVWLQFARYIIVTGKERGFDALLKSREYARGNFWNIFMLTFLGAITMFLFSTILEPLNRSNSGTIIYTVVTYLISPLWLIYYYLIFDHLRKIKGDVSITNNASQKNLFTVVAGLGLIVIMALFGLLVYYYPAISAYIESMPAAAI